MADYITIDGGTTNTRISLVKNHETKDIVRLNVGARSGMENRSILRQTIKEGINLLLERNGLTEGDIAVILASGMLTSEFGLVELPHITAPAGPYELAEAMHHTVLPDISSIPFAFVCGIKTDGDLASTDIMRGEESELTGLFLGQGVYILPGSHSKIIKVDEKGRITTFKTTLTGELIAALSRGTILKDALDMQTAALDEEFLLKGYEYAAQQGINEALFKVRLLKTVFKKNPAEIYGFFMGAVLCDEIKYILSLKAERLIISGEKHIATAQVILLENLSSAEIIRVPQALSDTASTLGMIKIYELKNPCFI